ncbi:Transcription factor [Cordyceps fumosorosea ARSEF 2679]|uniref:Transcription factor n=1 Tax=Cordyceps fumosorosea (strain ARSEF 2679) TaxID=1081104 RepID=A0A167UCS5_CORFA|nr:Transcription factor [Cordyceps fumosorosea ARSEF 2679]OAA61457.1 Transcription factor [Cordyceps fumosorosea ARSEF 2679]
MLHHISTSPNTDLPFSGRSRKGHRGAKRQPLSCLPCRHHKLRCDRQVPCGTCVRYDRKDLCQENPAPRHANKSTSSSISPLSSEARETAAQPAGIDADTRPNLVTRQRTVQSIPPSAVRQAQTIGGLSIAAAAEQLQSSRGPCAAAHRAGTPLAAYMSQSSIWSLLDPVEGSSNKFWKDQLVNALPTRGQCDILTTYYFEHHNWLWLPVHAPSFRREYAHFWDTHVDEADLLWLSLLFSIISVSALYIPFEAIEIVSIPRTSIRKLARSWHLASQQALHVGEHETKPRLVQIQTFIVSRLYWFATNNFEILNSRLGQAVRHAHALNLDKNSSPSKNLDDEIQHRLWSDLVDTDTFQAICLDRPPLIRVEAHNVPLPLNCNDVDLTSDSIVIRPIHEPTEATLKVHMAQLFQLINKRVCSGNGTFLTSYENVVMMEKELLEFMQALPWYLQPNARGSFAGFEYVKWQHHILRTCVATQRIRMHKPFLSIRGNESWRSCAEAAQDALTVYKEIRLETAPAYRQKFFTCSYQIFSIAVTIAALILVEGAQPFPDALEWLQNLARDLRQVEDQGCFAPLAQHGRTVLTNMIAYYERHRPYTARDAEKLVSDISVILGGEQATRAYLGRYSEEHSPSAVRVGSSIVPPAPMTAVATLTTSGGVRAGEAVSPDGLAGIETAIFGYQALDSMLTLDLLNWDMTGALTDALNAGG